MVVEEYGTRGAQNERVHETRVEALLPRRLYTSWPAIFAGLLVTIATVWLLSLLGTAIGVSVLDGTDAEALGNGFGIGAVIWLVVSGLAAFLIGGLVTGRLCGQNDDQAGLLHGVTMWSAATVLMIVLSYWGVSGLINTGGAIVANAARSASSAVGALPSAVDSESDFSNQRSRRIITGISAAVKQEIAEAAAAEAESAISEEEARQAIESLDAEAMEQLARNYVYDDADAARDTLAAKTNLSEKQVDQLSASISNKVQDRVEKFKADAAAVAETASSYAQAVLWTAFVTSALGLIVSILGGMLGCHTAVRLHTVALERDRVAA